MPDKVSCVHCDRSYEVDFSKGTSIRCFCGKLIRFPEMPSQPPDSHIRFSCPSCSKPYKILVEKAGQERICPSCSTPFTIPSHSTLKHKQEQPKLIDCLDCGSSISSSAFFCMKCGRPSPLAAERAKTQGCAMMLLIYVLSGLVLNESIKWIIQGVLNSR